MARAEIENAIQEIGAKPSTSEERGLGLIRPDDIAIFSPGISTGGIAEIRMALANPDRKIISTTIDPKGYEYALKNICALGLDEQIIVKLEDLTKEYPYSPESIDFIYSRLVLHYLSYQELNSVLANFSKSLKPNGKLYVVVRSTKNLEGRDLPFDQKTRFTKEPWGNRYFHSPESITEHLLAAGFEIEDIREYQEQLYKDFMRTELSDLNDHVIEVVALKK